VRAGTKLYCCSIFTLQTPIQEAAQTCKDDFKDDTCERRDSQTLPTSL